MIHPLAWTGWVIAALAALSVTRNPLYLVLALLCIAIVNSVAGSDKKAPEAPISPLRFALVVIPLSALFNAATAHFGETVLFRLPAGIPVLGGPITLEASVFGLLNGLALAGIFVAFTTLNLALPVRSLIRLVPQAFYPVAVVISIAVTFVPVTLRQFRQIREAQAVRGHRVRGLRGWLPLFMPLLIGGLERALQLAEAMTARGFASAGEERQSAGVRTAVVLGLVALLSGWLLRLVWNQDLPGLGLMLLGAGLIIGALWVAGRRVQRTTYRPEPWQGRDWGVVLGAAVVLSILVLPGRDSLSYYPYPALTRPGFDLLVGAAMLGLLGPALALIEK